MSLKILINTYELLDDIHVDGQAAASFLQSYGANNVSTNHVLGENGKETDFVKCIIVGSHGKIKGGSAPTLGIIGRLGGIGARPERLGFTSDGDGALCAIAIAAKLSSMSQRGDQLPGDVIITTHICPTAPTRPHEPVPFMRSPISSAQSNQYEIDPQMDAVLSIDTTKGNRIFNERGFAISPTVKEGWILRTSESLLSIMQTTTGELPKVFALTQQDITPYGNGLYHLNSIMQPSVATDKPCVGIAVTTHTQVAGCATGATHLTDLDEIVRFCIEVAKEFTTGNCSFYDDNEFKCMVDKYGSLSHFQSMGKL